MPTDDLARWIDALDRLPTEGLPSREEAHAIAAELGLGEDVVERAAAEADDHRRRGNQLLDRGLTEEAVRELDLARTLDPWSDQVRVDLERTHLARRVSAGRPSRSPGLPVLLAVLVTFPLGVAVGYGLAPAPAQEIPVEASVVEPEPAPAAPTIPVGLGEVAARLEPGVPDGVELEIARIELTKTGGGGWILSIGVLAHVETAQILSRLELLAEARDANGVRLASTEIGVVEDHEAPVHQGEQAQGHGYLRGTGDLGAPAEVVFRVAESEAHPGSSEPAEVVELAWPPEVDSSLRATIRRRSGGTCRTSFGNSGFCEGLYVVENTGSVPIDTLKVAIQMGEAVDETYAISGHGRAVLPGEKQTFRVIESIRTPLPETPWTWRVLRADSD